MIGLRLAVAAVLAAAVVAGCITYFLIPAVSPPVEAGRMQRLVLTQLSGVLLHCSYGSYGSESGRPSASTSGSEKMQSTWIVASLSPP